MNTGDLLTVKEFAQAAGVSRQTIYNRLDKDLTAYLTELDSVKYIDKAALQIFKSNEPVKFDRELDSDLTGYLTALDTQAAEIETLKQQLATLQDQLTAKDTQISLLQAHTDRQQQTIDSLTTALTAAQTLQALEKQERLKLTAGDLAETETEGDTAATAPEPVKSKSLFDRLFRRRQQ